MSKRAGRNIPYAATQADQYSEAIMQELEMLNDNLERLIGLLVPAAAEPATDEVELREPASAKAPAKKAAHRDAKE